MVEIQFNIRVRRVKTVEVSIVGAGIVIVESGPSNING